MGTYKVYLYGPRTPEAILEALGDWVDFHAWRLAETAPGQVDNLYYQDLFQEGMLTAYRLLERDPHIWGPKLLRLTVLGMYAARRRGRSVFRADPYRRQRTYEQVSLDAQAVGMDESEIVGDASDGWDAVDVGLAVSHEGWEGGLSNQESHGEWSWPDGYDGNG